MGRGSVGVGEVRTDDKCPAESSTTQFETLIEKRRTALHRLQNGRISLRKARWQVTLYDMWARVSSVQFSIAGKGWEVEACVGLLEWEEIEEKNYAKRTNLPAICALVLIVLSDIFVLLVGGICGGIPSNIRVCGKEPLSRSADRVWHGRGGRDDVAPREEVGGK